MDLEFDKEIDAILRKARPNRGVLVGDDPPEENGSKEQKKHIDADSIAAFVENAVPEKARLLYIEHFADCNRCRQQLSLAMRMTPGAVSEKSAVETHVETVPWYQSIFRVSNLALVMGSLVLVFSAILGFLILQNRNDTSNATVSQIKEPDQGRVPPIMSENGDAIPTPSEVPMQMNTNASAANSVSNSSLAGAPDAAILPRGEPPAKPADAGRDGQFQIDGASGSENTFIIDGQEINRPRTDKKPATPPLGGQPTTDSSVSSQTAELLPKGLNMSSMLETAPEGAEDEREKKKAASDNRSGQFQVDGASGADVLKERSKDDDSKRKNEDRGLRRDFPAPAAKVGPAQANQANNTYQMSVTRVAGGKTFSNRDGVWYDSTYKNQATLNYRRGSSDYKKLDGALRRIADTLGGTVVIVWKAKAYRIQ